MRRCFWESAPDMEKVMITGATGLIGSHVAEVLCDRGYSCVAFVRAASRLPKELARRVDIRTGDIRDLESLVAA
jgi:uncharacterized protein YbjT (DUF2867 family)